MRLFMKLVFSFLLFLLISREACAEDSRSKNVLLLLPGQPGMPGIASFMSGVRKTLTSESGMSVGIYAEHLNLEQFPFPEYEQDRLRWVRTKYSRLKLDAVITANAASYDFALKWRDTLWPNVPIIFTIRDLRSQRAFPFNVTGINMPIDFGATVKAALRLQPETKHLVVIYGSSEDDRYNFDYAMKQIAPLVRNLDVIPITGLPLPELEKRLAVLPENSIIFNAGYYLDGAGQLYFPPELIARVSAKSNSPIYEANFQAMGFGTVGGLLTDYGEAGTEAGVLTLRILNGEQPSSIPPQTTKSAHFVFDWRQLQKWGIDESTLPSGSKVLFRSPSFWEEYKWGIVGAITLLILETMLIAALLTQRSARISAENKRRAAELETQQHRIEIAHVTRAASMNELASSLAHQLSQPLTAIMSNAEVAARLLDRNPPDLVQVREILKDVVDDDERAKEIISGMRSLLKKGSGQSQLVDLNQIVRIVIRLTDAEAALRKVKITVALQEDLPQILGYPIRLQQVVLNLLMNGMDAVHEKTDEKRSVEIRTTIKDDSIQLVISDSGQGIHAPELAHVFQPFYSTKPEGLGMGLPICKTIVESLNGRIWAESIPGQGATFFCSFPSAQSSQFT